MASRLDKLLELLDTGSSLEIRLATAKNIAHIATKCLRKDSGIEGDAQEIKPALDALGSVIQPLESTEDWSDVISVVAKILPLLRSKNIETRNAAANTLSQICTLAPVWAPLHPALPDAASDVEFPPFSVEQILESGKLLLSSSGQEFNKAGGAGSAAELERARREAKTRLGLDFLDGDEDDNGWTQELMEEAANVNVDDEQTNHVKSPDSKMDATSPMSRTDDPASPMSVDTPYFPLARPGAGARTDSHQLSDDRLDSPTAEYPNDTALSARERNRLKRKRRQEEGAGPIITRAAAPPAKIRIVEQEGKPTPKPAASSPPPNEDEKIVIDPQKGGQVEAKEKSSHRALEVKPGQWIWAGLMKVLSVDLFNANWETRHGTALALREVIKLQGAHAGTLYNATAEENAINHAKWCNDMAAKLLCVFVMDRFSDYVSDQVVAPVRESATQALAALLLHMPESSVYHVHRILLAMIRQDLSQLPAKKPKNGYVWQVRHAGLLGLKYEVAVREDLIERQESRELLRGVVEAALLGLADADDDVRSAAAGCLIPVCGSIVRYLLDDLPKLLAILWSCFESMKDDLSSSVSAVMDLLGALVAFPDVMAMFSDSTRSRPLDQLAPLLFPFFRHTISNVRLAVVRTLYDFLSVPSLPYNWANNSFFRLLFQNVLLEERDDIRALSVRTWRLALGKVIPNVSNMDDLIPVLIFRDWIETCTTPLGDPIDTSRLFILPHFDDMTEVHNVDKNMISQDLSLIDLGTVWKARIASAQCLAILANALPQQLHNEYFDLPLKHYLNSPSYFHKFMGATILQEWSSEYETATGNPFAASSPLADELSKVIVSVLVADPPACYHETLYVLDQLCRMCNSLVISFLQDSKFSATNPGLPQMASLGSEAGSFTLVHARSTVDWLDNLHNLFQKPKKKKDVTRIDDSKRSIRELIHVFEEMKSAEDSQVAAAFASAAIALKAIPPKLTPLIKGVMNSIKTEEIEDLQRRSAGSLAAFIHFSSTSPSSALSNSVDKVIKNLCVFLCQDEAHTPLFAKIGKEEGILSFNKVLATTVVAAGRHKDVPVDEPKEIVAARIMRRGGVAAFVQMTMIFGSSLFEKVPKIWQCVSEELLKAYPPDSITDADAALLDGAGQGLLDTLTALRDVLPTLHADLHSKIEELFPSLLLSLQSKFAVIRQAVSKCYAAICDVMTSKAMLFLVQKILPLIDDVENVKRRQGAVELIFHVVGALQMKILPYILFLVVPLLGRMNDVDEDIRSAATNSFATLIQLMPLEHGLPDPPGFPEQLLKKRDEERTFLSQLLGGGQVENYQIPVTINAELRKYQQEGVNWLAFLRKYQLHGILCDDMGLGKTLQSICILASAHHERAERNEPHLPSFIVCPPTLTNHWLHEINRYANNLKPIIYAGPVKERRARSKRLKQYDVVITSYDVVRNDINVLAHQTWLYCILDEGHLIKNARSKVSQAVKTIKAHHRLILSGTPIQNNLLELWSLFDFLMPGFLGNESQFNERFARPVLASKEGKMGAKGAESAARALEALHKQALPFLLRRMKENVLNDLPPKIIQDYYCDVSPLQQLLFEEFQTSKASEEATTSVKSEGTKGHVFQALQYLRKVCNHPALVLKDEQPETAAILEKLAANGEDVKSVRDIENAPKLLALKQLLQDCGIGVTSKDLEAPEDHLELPAEPPQHRCLIFCQMKMMVDVIEKDLFQTMMPTVSYMRLDGTTESQRRHAIVQTFNDDPSIDCLLLTTHIGGLGLTLTGADTVIFVEHDWNPMKDLQAMDRAHRLGQKRVVNVYRLITKGTLEEKIMGLQRFKLNIANTVVTQQNAGLESMDTDLVLDLFRKPTTDQDDAAASNKRSNMSNGPVSQKDILSGLEELHGEDEYADMNLESFMSTLRR